MIELHFLLKAVPKAYQAFDGRLVTTKRVKKFQNQMKMLAKTQYKGKPLETALHVEIFLFFKRPKSVSAKKRPFPIVKPDLDNCSKSILDSLNKIVFADDSQICSLTLHKDYSMKDMINIHIKQIETNAE